MILEALARHYDHLNDAGEVAAFGFAARKVTHQLVLDRSGRLKTIVPLGTDKKQWVTMRLPDYGKKRTAQNRPFFCSDNAEYVFGTAVEEKDQSRAAVRLDLFHELHSKHVGLTRIPLFNSVVKFLDSVVPGDAAERSDWESIQSGTFVFCLDDETGYLHENEEVRGVWLKMLAGEKQGERGTCLVTGKQSEIAILHPAIKGVIDPGGQSEKGIVAFNSSKNPAFDSFSKTQSLNAPVSVDAAFKYATALNYLLASDRRRVSLGDTTCVFWTDRPETRADDAFAHLLGGLGSAESKASAAQAKTTSGLQDFLARFAQGKHATAPPDGSEAPFYILGLAPNAARISVRFWHVCTVGDLAQRLAAHVERVTVYDAFKKTDIHPTLREMLRETGREAKDIPPQLAGDLARAIVLGGRLPDTLAVALLRRMKAEQSDDKRNPLSSARAAGLKAWLNRNHHQEVPVALDSQRPDPAYRLGRLFSAYERVQADAAGTAKLNRSIRDSYLSSASATPGGIFPRLYRLNQHHLNKLRRDKPGLAVVREKLIGEICCGLDDFPRHLSVQHQGLFALGYYHQTQDFFTKRDAADTDADATLTAPKD